MKWFTGRSVGVVLLLAVSFFFCVRWVRQGSPGTMERYASYVAYPLLVVQRSIVEPIQRWCVSRETMRQLKESLELLRSERDQLMADVIQLRSQLQYIDDVHLLAESNRPFEQQIICNAQIIAKQFSDHEHSFLIDAGSSHGVTTDMVVIFHNCLVGKVVQVYPWYSKVIVLTDATCKIAACCYKTKTVGIHEGKNDVRTTQLGFVSHLDNTKNGDYIFSSGEGLIFPRGLGIGRIVDIKKEGVYQVINVKPLVDLNRIKFCSVLHRGAQLIPSQT